MDDPIVFPKQHEEINVVVRPEENINHDKDCTVGWNQFWKIILLILRFHGISVKGYCKNSADTKNE